MIRIFDEEQFSDEAQVAARGGLLVIADERADLETLVTLCLSLRSSPGMRLDVQREQWEPMRGLYAALLIGGALWIVTPTNDSEWTAQIYELAWQTDKNDLEYLALALATVSALWDTEKSALGGLQLCLAVTRPGAGPEVELNFRRERSRLFVTSGSMVAGLTAAAAIKGGKWLVTIAGKAARVAGPSAEAAGMDLIEKARKQGELRQRHKLMRLDQLTVSEEKVLKVAPVVIVFFHGLFSTDAGTFDGFIDWINETNPLEPLPATFRGEGLTGRKEFLDQVRLQLQNRIDAFSKGSTRKSLIPRSPAEPKLISAFHLVGWPHNTLTSIAENASALADLLENTFLPKPPRVFFVCHSRGGLVARATIANLLQTRRSETWKQSLAGLITFGSPHNGAGITENSLRAFAEYFLYFHACGHNMTSLVDLLAYLDARSAEGINQLKPADSSTSTRPRSFVSELYVGERLSVKDDQANRIPPSMTIGGKVEKNTLEDWKERAAFCLVSHWLGTSDHDLVVELSSTTSRRFRADQSAVVRSGHFSYFEKRDDECDKDVLRVLMAWLWSEVDIGLAFRFDVLQPIVFKDRTP